MDLSSSPLTPALDFGGAEIRCLTLEWLTYISVDVHECGNNSTGCHTTGALDDMMAALMPRYDLRQIFNLVNMSRFNNGFDHLNQSNNSMIDDL